MDDQENKIAASQTDENVAESNVSSENNRCIKCNAKLAAEQHFCPNCGQQVGTALENDNTHTGKPRVNKILISIVSIIVVIAVIIAIVFVVRGTQAKSVTLSKDDITIKVGEVVSLSCVINPDNTKDKTITWHSSNELIAQVNDGEVVGVNEGNCVVSITTKNGKTDECSITVISSGPDLKAIYDEHCSSSFAKVASDGSYLTIDTNPFDIEDYFDYEAYLSIGAVNKALGLPEVVMNKMDQTRSMDGIQTYSTDEIELTWTYHPDKGLRVNYSLK